MTIKDLDPTRIPQHVAIIMDGNGRWAQRLGHERLFGHQNAITAIREAAQAARDMNIKYLTLYAFSTENWNRHKDEVDGLMVLAREVIKDQLESMKEHHIRLRVVGDLSRVPAATREAIDYAVEELAVYDDYVLTIALSYSSRWEIVNAVRQIAEEVAGGSLSPSQVDESCFERHLAMYGVPDPDLLIRTGGEQRISNYLLWQMAYAEFYFTDVLWPDFREEHFIEAVADYQGRQRRFGKSGDQVEDKKN